MLLRRLHACGNMGRNLYIKHHIRYRPTRTEQDEAKHSPSTIKCDLGALADLAPAWTCHSLKFANNALASLLAEYNDPISASLLNLESLSAS